MSRSTACLLRRTLTTAATNSYPAQAPSSLRVSRSSRRSASLATSADSYRASSFWPTQDLVGPPDPLSNLRPVVYAPGITRLNLNASASLTGVEHNDEVAKSKASKGKAKTAPTPHPYSLSEFRAPSSSSLPSTSSASSLASTASHPRHPARRPYSSSFLSLLSRYEAQDLSYRLLRLRADAFSNAFWRDNNARFEAALREWNARQAVLESSSVSVFDQGGGADGQTPSKEKGKGKGKGDSRAAPAPATEPDLSTFYVAWMNANRSRHTAYNRELWRTQFGLLRPAARHACLGAWVRVREKWERALGRG